MRVQPLLRKFLPATAALVLMAVTACTPVPDADSHPDLGHFKLGYDIVVASKMKKGPLSREATPDEFKTAIHDAVEKRLRGYDGDQLYHLGISVESYVLASPGIPLLLTPKSALLLYVTVWDDAENRKINDKPILITVMEKFKPLNILGSGLTMSREEQIQHLADRGAGKILQLLADHPEWFAKHDPSQIVSRAEAQAQNEALMKKAKPAS